MTQKVKQSLEQISKLSPKLNAATDQANRVVKLVEDFLAATNLGITASVYVAGENIVATGDLYSPENQHRVSRMTYLSYRRFKNRFCIVAEVQDESLDSDGDVVSEEVEAYPWLEAPRGLKLATFPRLPELLDCLADHAEKAVTAATETAGAITKLLEAFDDKAATGKKGAANHGE